MVRPRVIPCLLLLNNGLVKTKRFKKPVYIGDPINAVRIFNEKEVDELIFLDISATKENREPDYYLIERISSESFMPFAYGGGIKNLETAVKILKSGAEKVIINSFLFEDKTLINRIAEKYGNQSVVVAIDVKKDFFGKYVMHSVSGTRKINYNLLEYIEEVIKQGAGEIFINSINNDGMMSGYDIDLVKTISSSTEIPVVACGGAGSVDDIIKVIKVGGASAAAAGSLFVFYGNRSAVLINYPTAEVLAELY